MDTYQLVAILGEDIVSRQGFNDIDAAVAAAGEAFVSFPDCEVKLWKGDVVVLSAAPHQGRDTP